MTDAARGYFFACGGTRKTRSRWGISLARKTFYELLQVEKSATSASINEAFRRLALKYHPDKVVHLDVTAQRKALRRMQAISEAFATLRDPDSRALYDRCLRDGLDYAIEQWNLKTGDFAAEETTGQAGQQSNLNSQRATSVLDAILGLPGMMNNSTSDEDEYFDYIVKGRIKGHRYLIHIKNLDSIGVEDLMGIINYADQLTDEAGMLLTKAYHSYVVLGREMDDTLRVRATAEQYNSRMRRSQRGQPVRGLVLITDGERRPYVPYGEYLCPAYTTLNL